MTVFLPLLLSPFGQWTALEPCVSHTPSAIVMRCESGGYYGPPLDLWRGVRLAVDVRMTPAADSRGWAGLALNADIKADDRYAEVAIERGIAPYWGDTQAYGVHLSTPADRCCDRMIEAGDGWHHLEIVYQAGRADYAIDGVRASVAIDLGPAASVELLCVATDPGESKPGNRATCEFAGLVIEQPAERHGD